jgi:hypothetical protein
VSRQEAGLLTSILATSLAPIINAGLAVVGLLVALFGWRINSKSPMLRGALMALLGAILGYAVASFFFPDPWGRQHHLPPTLVRITFPSAETAGTPRYLPVEGIVQGLRPGQVLWAAHRANDEKKYYIADGPCLVASDSQVFSCPQMTVGSSNDVREFEIVVLVADTKAQAKLINTLVEFGGRNTPQFVSSPYIEGVPPDVGIGASVRKVRNP